MIGGRGGAAGWGGGAGAFAVVFGGNGAGWDGFGVCAARGAAMLGGAAGGGAACLTSSATGSAGVFSMGGGICTWAATIAGVTGACCGAAAIGGVGGVTGVSARSPQRGGAAVVGS